MERIYTMSENTQNQCAQNSNLLECEKLQVFALLSAVGGILGAYTYTLRGGVFCNAQTANFVLLSMSLGSFNWMQALYYLIPITAYTLGIVIAEIMPSKLKKFGKVRWDTIFVAFEAIVVGIIGFIPTSAPHQICQVTINFIAAMQFTTFRQAKQIPMATTFCTNHLRQFGVNLVKWIKGKNKDAKTKCLSHLLMIGTFVAGGICSAFLCIYFKEKAVWMAVILLIIIFCDLLYADLVTEKDKHDIKPHGH